MILRASLPLLFLCGVVGAAAPAQARQTPDSASVEEVASALPGPVGALQITTRSRVLADSASHAEEVIEGLREVAGISAEIEDARRRHLELQALLASMVDTEFVRIERLSRLQDHALIEDSRLEDVRGQLTDRLTELEEIDARWRVRRQLWESWMDTLRSEPELAGSEDEVTAALLRVQEVQEAASAAATVLLDLQTRVESLQAEIEQLGGTVTSIQTRRAQARFERSEPILLSSEHRAQLREGGWRAWDPTATIQPGAYGVFARNSAGLLAFHLLLALLVGGAVRALRSTTPPDEALEWSGLLERPWALGVFVSVIVAMTRITLAPPLWDVLLWSLFGASAAILARRSIRARALRLTVYLLAVFYPTFLLLEVSQVPEPVFRVGLAGVALCAIPLFLLLARTEGAAPAGDSRSRRARAARSWPLLLGAGVWTGVLVALIAGFDALARWMLHATVMSAAVVFAVAIGLMLVRGAGTTLSRLGSKGPLLRRTALLLAQRSSLVARITLLVVGALVLLDIWGLSGSPITTWQRIMEAGFTVGTFRVSVGRVLLGALVVYVTVLVSDLVRSLVTSGRGPNVLAEDTGGPLHAGRGVAESVTRLGQYAFVTLGLILALVLMGVRLQNFAIIAGALGIGVGFGLQNVVNNFASGLILLFERPVRVGDTVVVGGTWGTIQKIGLRSTLMLTLDESEMIVPNGDLVAEKVINWTLTSPVARVFLPVGVAYGSPVAQVQAILQEAAFAHPTVLKQPPPQALFMAFGESALEFELRVWVTDIRYRLEMRSAVLAEIDRRLREAGIHIPFPQRDLHVRSVDGWTPAPPDSE